MTTTQQENNEVAKEIFNQLNASSVNGFPFLSYTGLKARIFSETELYLKAPTNPNHIKNILIQYDYGSDTYTVIFNGSDRHTDIYADQLSEMIVRKMGVQ